MPGGTAVFTVVAKNYIPYARVLMRSVAEHHPEWRRFVILVDRVDGYFDPGSEPFETILSEELAIPHTRWFHFKYTILELSTAVKPFAFTHLLRKYDVERTVYLDPDIRTYSPLTPVTEALEAASIVLTPHLTAPLDDDRRPSEIDMLRSGAYNLGFLAVSAGRETDSFLAWWSDRLYDHCVSDQPRGLFVDQKWIDLVPGMFSGVSILRDPGCNVAYWNLAGRAVECSQTGVEVNRVPLRFFHFSGLDASNPDALSKYQNRFHLQDLPVCLRDLLATYSRELLEAGYLECRQWPYAYATFANGARIPDAGRPLHQEAPELLATVADPFSDEGFAAFLRVWNAPVGKGRPLSRIAYRIYRSSTELQTAMPDVFGGDYARFLEWLKTTGKSDHEIGPAFLETLPAKWSAARIPPVPNTRLAAAIYESRPELQRHFPDPQGRDAARYLAWLLTYGRAECQLSEHHVGILRQQWRTAVAGLPGIWNRARHRMILAAMEGMLRVRPLIARRFARGRRQPPQVPPQAAAGFGVNLVGYFQAETGVGESVRGARAALRAAGVPVQPHCVCDETVHGSGERLGCYGTNVFYVNADQTRNVGRCLGESFYRDRHNVGFWVWELDEFPDQWIGALSSYQEIWTPSTFCRDAVARKSPLPVTRIPYAVEPIAPRQMGREVFGLPRDRFVFLFAFDVLSVMERKNPIGVIRAFEKAFPEGGNCELVIKVNHADAKPECIAALQQACSSPNVRIVTAPFSREEVYGLIQCCDCVVSLHRSEGFGLLMAEAMYFGKPVIATNYSGNTDFTLAGNAMLVDYRLIPVGDGCAPYPPQAQWADPDLSHAARHMQEIVASSSLRERLQSAGRDYVAANLSYEAVGRLMRERLTAVRSGNAR